MPQIQRQLSFTKTLIEALPAAANGKRDYYNDTKIRGLQLVVTSTGSKSYYLYVRSGGKPLRHRLGSHPALTPENARRLAEKDRGRLATGVDLRAERQSIERNQVTVSDAFEAYAKVSKNRLKPKTLYYYARYLEVAFKEWKARPLVELTKDMIGKRHQKLSADSGPAYADGAMRFLRAVINFAQFHYEDDQGTPLMVENPVKRLSQTRAWNRVKRRTTYIKQDQLAPWFKAVVKLKSDPEQTESCTVADWLLLTILTGLRRTEGLALKWADVDLPNRTLTLRDPKNRIDHTLPLSDYIQELLQTRRDAKPDAAFVFGSYGKVGHLVDPRKQLDKITKETGVTFMPHDLRRTFTTVAESLDIPAYALKRLLNHKMTSDVTAGYIMTDVERLRKPMQQVTDYILRSAGLKPTAEVVDIGLAGAR